MSLLPLDNSFAVDQSEQELKDLFIKLWDEQLKDQADEIDFYGYPHLGDDSKFNLIERAVTQDGLSVIRGDVTEPELRYLYKAWKFRNNMRGTQFLQMYLRILFGADFTIDQMWQKKSETYPEYLRTVNEITDEGDVLGNFFLTSRLNVDITVDGYFVIPSNIINSIRTALAARFVLTMRIKRDAETEFNFVNTAKGVNICYANGTG